MPLDTKTVAVPFVKPLQVTSVFDTETTGTFPERDRIVEIAAFDPVRNLSFEELINPGMPIPKEAMSVHKISDQMVSKAASFKEVAARFLQFCDGDVALIAHNLDSFDLPFMKAEMKVIAT